MKKILLSLTMVLAIVALASCSLNSQTTIEFTKLPETVYEAGNYSQEEINAKLEAISVKVSGVANEINLTNNILTVSGFDAATLKTPGTYNLVVIYGSANVVFSYTVVAKVNPQPVSTADGLVTAIAAGGIIELEADIIITSQLNISKSVIIYGNGHKITANAPATRIFNVSGDDKAKVKAANIKISLYDLDLVSNGERCISLYYTQNIELNINNCKLSAKSYTLNLASFNEGTKINVDNSEIFGWAAINIWSNGADIIVKNSKISSYSNETGFSNSFGTIVLNGGAVDYEGIGIKAGDTGQNNNLTFEKCQISAEQSEESISSVVTQHLLVTQCSCANNIIEFNECELTYGEGLFYLPDEYLPASNEVYVNGVRK